MKKTYVFTSAAYNYLPKARLLFNSLKTYHPEFVRCLVLADKYQPAIDTSDEPIDEIIILPQLDIPDLDTWIFSHSIVELATAIKPFALKKILERENCENVIYLDPDIVIFSRLDEIIEALNKVNIVLTPHQTSPEETVKNIINNEICSLKHGIYNLGFLGVSANEEGKRFASWWSERTYHFCRDDIPSGLFTDQRWVDFVPVFFDNVLINKNTRFNVAPWNLTTRKLTSSDDNYLVDGEPLGFYHFTGFDSGAHKIMATMNSQNNTSVLSLVSWYEDELSKITHDAFLNLPWGFGVYSNGEPVLPEQRALFRAREDLRRAFQNPFLVGAGTFHAYWQNVLYNQQHECLRASRCPICYRWRKRVMEWCVLLKKAWKLYRREGPRAFFSRLKQWLHER